jgi:hypothetical protein
MRAPLAYVVLALSASCVPLRHSANVAVVDARGGPSVPPAVIRTPDEFEAFVRRVREPGATEPDGFAEQLEASRPDLSRQLLVLVRHDSNSDSTYGLGAAERAGTLVCDVRTRRRGVLRDYNPHWFAVVVDRPGPERIEVRVDGEPQPGAARGER